MIGLHGLEARAVRAIRRWGLPALAARLTAAAFDDIHTRLYAWILGIKVGRGTIIMPGARLRRGGGKIAIGRQCLIHCDARILAYGGDVVLGDGVSVNPFSILYGHGGLTIGDRVLIAAGTVIIPANHRIEAGRPIRGQGLTSQGIVIGNDVWIATGAKILDGSHVEDGAVLAAGCVLTGQHVPRDAIFGGVPARPIGTRRPPPSETLESGRRTFPS